MLDWLNDDQRALRDMAATFARKEVEPLATQIDREEHTPDSLIAKAGEFGLFGLYTSPEYGGAGCDLVAACLVVEEIAKAKMPDLTAADLDAAMRTVAGSARSMGILVEGM